MAGFTSALAAKEYADDYLHIKIFGQAPTGGDVWVDVDPGTDGPTDPGPPDDDPTESDVEDYILARHRHTMWKIRQAWDKGNP